MRSVGVPRSHLLLATMLVVGAMGTGAGALAGGLPFVAGSAATAGPIGWLGGAPTMTVVAADPVDVRNDAGDTGVVIGALSGSLAVPGSADRVEFLVRSRLPNGTWIEVERATISDVGAGEVALEEVFGETIYLDETQSDAFDVSEPGSAAVREGTISVTGRLFFTDGTASTARDRDTYRFTVDRPARTVIRAGASDGTAMPGDDRHADSNASGDQAGPGVRPVIEPRNDGGSTESGGIARGQQTGGTESAGTVSGEAGGEQATSGSTADASDGETASEPPAPLTTALVGVGSAMPGDGGEADVTLQSPGAEFERLTVSVGAVVDAENGRTEPEAEVDSTPETGELSQHLDIRAFILRATGDRQYIVGGPSEFSPLAAASGVSESFDVTENETVTLVVQWRIDADVGNEIQSDGTTLSFHTEFTS